MSGYPGGRRNGFPSIPSLRPKSEYVGHTLYSCRGAGWASMAAASAAGCVWVTDRRAAAVGQESIFSGIPVNWVITVKVITPVRASQSKVHHLFPDPCCVSPLLSYAQHSRRGVGGEGRRWSENQYSGSVMIGCPADHPDRIRRACAPRSPPCALVVGFLPLADR
jgi:hypothetical protein